MQARVCDRGLELIPSQLQGITFLAVSDRPELGFHRDQFCLEPPQRPLQHAKS